MIDSFKNSSSISIPSSSSSCSYPMKQDYEYQKVYIENRNHKMSVMQKLKVVKADRKQHPQVTIQKGHLTLYADPRSTCSRKVMLLLALKGINYDLVNIDLPAKGQKLPYFVNAYHPFGKVPVLVYAYMDFIDNNISCDVNGKSTSFSFSGNNQNNNNQHDNNAATSNSTVITPTTIALINNNKFTEEESIAKKEPNRKLTKNRRKWDQSEGQKGIMREVIIYESYAIIRYIAEKFAIKERTNYFNNQKNYNDQLDVLYSPSIDTKKEQYLKGALFDGGELEAKAKLDSWLSIAANYFKPNQMIIQKELVLKKRYQTGSEPDMNKVEEALKVLHPILDTMERIFPQDSLFFMSNTYLSIADIAFLPELDMLEVSGVLEDLLLPRPKLHRWYFAMKEQEDWQRVISIPVLQNGGPFPSPFHHNVLSFSATSPVDLPQKEKVSIKAAHSVHENEFAQSTTV